MSTRAAASGASAETEEVQASWLPMIVIAMGQMLMSFNVAALPVSMSGMVNSFNTPPTTVGTAIVMYSLGVSGFVMLGAKLGQRFGSKIFFQAAVVLFLAAMVLMVISPRAEIMLAAQALAGFAGASLVPSLVALIANHYRGRQQAKAVGWLGSARAIAGVLAFVIVGYVAMINFLNNDRLKERFEGTKAAAGQIAEAVRINTETRLQALKVGFFVLAGIAFLAIVPCGWLPDYKPGDIPSSPPPPTPRRA